eukprot:951920-Prymnesium_polylepis.1
MELCKTRSSPTEIAWTQGPSPAVAHLPPKGTWRGRGAEVRARVVVLRRILMRMGHEWALDRPRGLLPLACET